MAHANIVPTSTFLDWFNLTNEIATTLRSNAVVTGITAEGVFAIGIAASTELNISNGVFVNSSVVQLRSNTAVQATVGTFDVAPGQVLVHPSGNTSFTTAVFVNAVLTLQKTLTGNANVSIIGKIEFTGNTTVTGNAIAMIGAFSVSNGASQFSGNVTVSNSSFTSLFVDRVNGLVGLGTASPTHLLEVAGNSQFSGNTTVAAVLELSGASARLVLPVGTDLWATV